jgi:hypothetical protein
VAVKIKKDHNLEEIVESLIFVCYNIKAVKSSLKDVPLKKPL